jgi:glycosyltransferase involved in cell wall biosynthesis
MNPVVTIVYRFLPQYRVEFFSRLRHRLHQRSLDLRLVYGRAGTSEKGDERDVPWGAAVTNCVVRCGPVTLHWQPLPAWVAKSDLVILMQETKLVSNFPLLVRRKLGGKKVGFWGHGINFQEDKASLANRLKTKYSTAVDWWFAYTCRTAEMISEMGFPRERITVVQNAIDTRPLIEASKAWNEHPSVLRGQLGLGNGPVALFCGGMYSEKRLPFVLNACQSLRAQFPSFEVVFIGGGPESRLVAAFAAEREWAHYVGPKFDGLRVPYFKAADVLLMPGAVGLIAVDCFALELPLVTTDYAHHGPEIEYVESGYNGFVSANTLDAYVTAVAEVLASSNIRENLRLGCRASAARYTLDTMVDNFVAGVESALAC